MYQDIVPSAVTSLSVECVFTRCRAMLDGKLILVLSFLCVTPLTIWELATCEDRKYKLKCFRGAAKLEISFFPGFLHVCG